MGLIKDLNMSPQVMIVVKKKKNKLEEFAI